MVRFRNFSAALRSRRFWWDRFGPMFANEIRKRRIHRRSYSQWRWHLDEVFVKINGETHYLWRAVDHEGEVLEVFATKRRDRKATLKFLKRTMKGIVTLTTHARAFSCRIPLFMLLLSPDAIAPSLRLGTDGVSGGKSDGVACRSCCRWRRGLRGNVALIQAT